MIHFTSTSSTKEKKEEDIKLVKTEVSHKSVGGFVQPRQHQVSPVDGRV